MKEEQRTVRGRSEEGYKRVNSESGSLFGQAMSCHTRQKGSKTCVFVMSVEDVHAFVLLVSYVAGKEV